MFMEAFTLEIKARYAAGKEGQMDQEEVNEWLEKIAVKL
jgi:hypothetical protein